MWRAVLLGGACLVGCGGSTEPEQSLRYDISGQWVSATDCSLWRLDLQQTDRAVTGTYTRSCRGEGATRGRVTGTSDQYGVELELEGRTFDGHYDGRDVITGTECCEPGRGSIAQRFTRP